MPPSLRQPALLIPAATMVLGTLALMSQARPFYMAFIALPFALGPLVLPMILAPLCPAPAARRLLTLASILYAAWFAFVFVGAFILRPDAQSGIALFLIGFWSLPVLLPLCIAAWLRRHSRQECRS